MKLGFIGTGALTSAITIGLKCAADNSVPVLLSPRNKEIAGSPASRYPDVRVAPDNQTVLDNCDTIMLAVRPHSAHAGLPPAQARRLAAGARLELIGGPTELPLAPSPSPCYHPSGLPS